MPNGILYDSKGNKSSKRLVGLISFFIAIGLVLLDGFSFFNINETLVIAIFGFSSGLLGLDSVTDIWKQNGNS